MPIYEYACPKCRVIFNFLSKRIKPDHWPICPKCGNKKMTKQVSRFAMSRGLKEPAAKAGSEGGEPPMPDFDDARVEHAMMELELSLDFDCCACDAPVAVTVHCSGKGLLDEREGGVAVVHIPCPTCGQGNQVYFETGGKVRKVRPCYSPRPVPAPSLN